MFRGSQNRIFFSGVQWEKPRKNPMASSLHGLSPPKFNGWNLKKCMVSKAGISKLPGTSDFRFQPLNFRGVLYWKPIKSAICLAALNDFHLLSQGLCPPGFFSASGQWGDRSVVGGFRIVPRKIRSRFFWWCKYRVGSMGFLDLLDIQNFTLLWRITIYRDFCCPGSPKSII